MNVENAITPEDLIVAVLHKIGADFHLRNDSQLAYLFNQASIESPEFFSEFAWHPQYHDSKILNECLRNLEFGGAIVRETLLSDKFRASQRVAGDYGRNIFDSLPAKLQQSIKDLGRKVLQKSTSCLENTLA